MTIPNWQNRTLFHGDNLTFLRAMDSEAAESLHKGPYAKLVLTT